MAVNQRQKIPVAVSSCLLGEKVRYDGADKRNELVLHTLCEVFSYVSFCPEVSIGLGVPRPPVHLVRHNNKLRAIGVDDPAIDVTEKLEACAHSLVAKLEQVGGYIFKQRSPSCGINGTPVFARIGEQIGLGDGVFAATIRTTLPKLPVIDEESLEDPVKREKFIQEVSDYYRCKPAVK